VLFRSGGISHVNLMVDNVDVPYSGYAAWWNASALDAALPPSARVGGVWGPIYPSWSLHDPGCDDGAAPLFPWMRGGRVGVAIWELWTGATDSLAAIVAAVRAPPGVRDN
jgi:hypothetical protein